MRNGEVCARPATPHREAAAKGEKGEKIKYRRLKEHDRNPANIALATSRQRRKKVNPRSGLASILGTGGAYFRVGTYVMFAAGYSRVRAAPGLLVDADV